MEKVGLVETCRWYEVAPDEAFQASVGVVETLVEPLAGDDSTGASGGDTPPAVVNLQRVEYALVPPLFVALTCQK